jgi:Plant ATP synthase F0.
MPQLDPITYFTQYFWLLVVFFTLYVIVATNILPHIGRILKTRNKLKSTKTTLSNKTTVETSKFETVLMNTLLNTKNINSNIIENGKVWLNDNLSQTNKVELNSVNEKYINTIGSLILKKNIK